MRTSAKLVLALVCLLTPAVAYAQASIAGNVKDASGAVLPGVTVEAASPALIEKTRSVVTDGAGEYRIVDLRPGAYTVTFTLPGFNTVKREGVELSGSGTATVSVEMKVGAIEETITVTGATPLVDVQSATKQAVLAHDVLDAIPAGRQPNTYASLLPSVTNSASDVGGTSLTGNLTTLSNHGITGSDQRTTANGVTWNTATASGSNTPAYPNMAAFQEVTVDTSAMSAELGQGGVRMNLIPKDGGNKYSGTFTGVFTNSSLAMSNFTDELKAAGLKAADSLRRQWDVNPGVGGPFIKDKLWFYGTVRYNGSGLYAGGAFPNLNANNPNAWVYVPDLAHQSSNDTTWRDAQLRLTWQATPRNKVAVSYDQQYICECLATITSTQAPEAARYWYFPLERGIETDWSSPVTNKLLLEAVTFTRIERYIMQYVPGLNPLMIHTVDQLTGLNYRARDSYANTYTPSLNYRVAVSYITGSHAFKVGFNDGWGTTDSQQYDWQPLSYRLSTATGVPVINQLTQRAFPYKNLVHMDHDMGLFVQDKWTRDRLTMNLALRWDHYQTSFPANSLGPTFYFPTRNISFPETDNLKFNDLEPRVAVAWDVFGNGKTAIKASASKYVGAIGLTGTGLGSGPGPINTLVLSTTRSWTDRNNNFIPDCNLFSGAAQTVTNGDICGAWASANFGATQPANVFDPSILAGWGHRSYNWEFAASVQREIVPRVSLDVGYFRRIFGNFIVTDNLAVAGSDYNAFSFTAPVDPRLPGGGGNAISGFYDLNPAAFGRPLQNYVTFTDNYGKQIQHWNGVDITLNARPGAGVFLQGGITTGRTSVDACAVAAAVPESLGTTALQFCAVDQSINTQVKFIGGYTVPKVAVQVSGTVQSVPGPIINANFTATSAQVQPTLGRPLSGGAANTTLNLVGPSTLLGERLNQLDLRFAKLFRYRSLRGSGMVDIFNVFNTSAVTGVNSTYAVWQTPTTIVIGRFVKFGVQLDF